jgi:hypothetical protein
MSTSDHPGFGAVSLLAGRPEHPSLRAEIVLQTSPDAVDSALGIARKLAGTGALPGGGSTPELWESLATAVSIDLGAARAIEPHLDAIAILDQARQAGLATVDSGDATWGVFASEGGDHLVIAVHASGRWTLKARSSGARSPPPSIRLSCCDTRRRMLFALDLDDVGVRAETG